jgi:EmrB/QacA subfamily drug resistance transporter
VPEAASSSRVLTLAAVMLANVLAVIDYNIVSVAVPDLLHSFPDATLRELSWIMNGYTIVFAAVLLPAGGLADRFGGKRLFLSGIGVFSLASLLCALAPDPLWLVAARMLQATGGGVMVTTTISLGLAALPDQRSRLFGLFGATSGVAAAAGPSVGGALLSAGGWHLIFLVNLPIAVIVVLCGWRGIRGGQPSASEVAAPLPDATAALLLTAAVASLALFLVQGNTWGWGSAWSLGALAAGLTLAAVGVLRSLRHPNSAIDLTLLRQAATAVGNSGIMLISMVQFTVVLCATLFLTTRWHYSPARAGLALTPGAITASVASWLGGRLTARLGVRLTALAGSVIAVCGWGWIALAAGSVPDYRAVLLPGLVFGMAGTSALSIAISTVAVRDVPADRFGMGSALVMLARAAGAAIGVAALTATLATTSPLAFRMAWTGIAACLAAVLALALSPAAAGVKTPEKSEATPA